MKASSHMMTPQQTPQKNNTPSRRVRIAGKILRALFIGILIVVTARVASPQTKSFWSAYQTPDDLIRVALGFSVCLWLAVHVFILPKDAEAYRTWLYLGLAVLPLALICAIVIW
jgi:TRAP-type C4-dicarboxylate transport system permease small subunit